MQYVLLIFLFENVFVRCCHGGVSLRGDLNAGSVRMCAKRVHGGIQE